MTVNIKIQNTNWEEIKSFVAEDFKSISQMAQKNWVDLPVACCIGACYVCSCKIKSWSEYIQPDKITTPVVLPEKDENWNYKDVLTCVWWIKSEFIKDNEIHEVILEKSL